MKSAGSISMYCHLVYPTLMNPQVEDTNIVFENYMLRTCLWYFWLRKTPQDEGTGVIHPKHGSIKERMQDPEDPMGLLEV